MNVLKSRKVLSFTILTVLIIIGILTIKLVSGKDDAIEILETGLQLQVRKEGEDLIETSKIKEILKNYYLSVESNFFLRNYYPPLEETVSMLAKKPSPISVEDPLPMPAGEPSRSLEDVINSNNRGNTIGNIANGGYVVAQGSWLYFCNNTKVFRSKLADKSQKELIYQNDKGCIGYLNLYEDYLYFQYSGEDYNQTIARISLSDVVEEQVLLTDSSYWSNLTLYKDRMYYINKANQIVSANTDGSDGVVLSGEDDCASMLVSGEWIYYINYDDAVSYKAFDEMFDGEGVELLGKIYRINRMDHHKEVITQDGVSSFCIHEDWIYYANGADGEVAYSEGSGWYMGRLYKIKIDGSENTKMLDSTVSSINATEEGLYFQELWSQMSYIGLNGENYRELFDIIYTSGPNIIGNELFCIDSMGMDYDYCYTNDGGRWKDESFFSEPHLFSNYIK